MPATFDRDFALWLTQHGSERAQAVNVLEFVHPKWGSLFVSDYGQVFSAATEAPIRNFNADPLGFVIDIAADNVSTEQRILLRIDNANGLVAQQLRSLTDEDIQTGVVVIYRAFLDSKITAPAIDPVTLLLTSVTMTRLVIECEASADFLPNVAAGSRYTLEAFPPLAYL